MHFLSFSDNVPQDADIIKKKKKKEKKRKRKKMLIILRQHTKRA